MAASVDLAAVDGLLQHVLDQGFALVEELLLQGVVERRVARHLDKHRADGAGVLAALLAADLAELAADRPAACRYSAGPRPGGCPR